MTPRCEERRFFGAQLKRCFRKSHDDGEHWFRGETFRAAERAAVAGRHNGPLGRLRARHERVDAPHPWCLLDYEPWPCETIRLLDAAAAGMTKRPLTLWLGPSPNELDAVRAVHHRIENAGPDDMPDPVCAVCYMSGEPWPCAAATLVARLDEMLAAEEKETDR